MRLNAGLPVWHVSVSAWSGGKRSSQPKLCEREAVRLLRGVGGEREWWFWNADAVVGHLRVSVTGAEHDGMPCGVGAERCGRERTGEEADEVTSSSEEAGIIDHADCAWRQVGPCVYCTGHGVRLFQGDLPERKRTIPRCEPDAHDWDDETGRGFYSHCRTCGLNEWYE